MSDNCHLIDKLEIICKRCELCELGRAKVTHDHQIIDSHVPGWRDGMSPLARVMIVGPAPTADDALEEQPLQGEAGHQFDQAIEKYKYEYGINRTHFYITNLVKCCSRKPTSTQIAACSTYLKAELALIKPKLIVILGSLAFRTLCPELDPMNSLGKVVRTNGMNMLLTYHPGDLDSETRLIFRKHIYAVCKMIFMWSCPF